VRWATASTRPWSRRSRCAKDPALLSGW
jgi:hypothetical protein